MKQKERFTKELDELTTNKNESMIDVMQSELEEVDDKITDKKIKMQNIERCAILCMTIHYFVYFLGFETRSMADFLL